MDCWLLLLLFIGLNGSIRSIISPQTAYADVWSLYPGAGRRCLKLPSIALIDHIETFFICICRCWKMLQCSLRRTERLTPSSVLVVSVFNTEINVTETSCISGWTAEKTIESLDSKRQSDAHTQSIIFIFIYELSRRRLHAPPASRYANVSMGHTQTCSLPHLPLVLLSADYSWLLLINYLLINWPINQ